MFFVKIILNVYILSVFFFELHLEANSDENSHLCKNHGKIKTIIQHTLIDKVNLLKTFKLGLF